MKYYILNVILAGGNNIPIMDKKKIIKKRKKSYLECLKCYQNVTSHRNTFKEEDMFFPDAPVS